MADLPLHSDDLPDGASGSEETNAGIRRLRSLVHRLPGAVYRCTYDTEWRSLYMGDGFREICGIDPESLDPAGRSYREVVLDEDRSHLQASVREAVKAQTYYAVEYRIWTDAGDIRWVEDHGRPYFNDDGSVAWLDGILLDVTERKEAEAALRELNATLEEKIETRTDQLRRLAAKLAMAEQRERDQIARVLHDDLQQLLYSVQVHVQMLHTALDERGLTGDGAAGESDPPPALKATDSAPPEEAGTPPGSASDPDTPPAPSAMSGSLPVDPATIETLLQQAIETTRGITIDLAPPVLEGDGLLEALQWLRSHLHDTCNFTVHLQGELPDVCLPEELRMVLFQAVRELLHNAMEHAGVKQASVTVTSTDGDLELRIEDRGDGFDLQREMAAEHDGFGLKNVVERLRFFGGRLTVETTLGEGTCVSIRLPERELQRSL